MGLEKTARTVSARFFEPHVFYLQEMLGAGETGETGENSGILSNLAKMGVNWGKNFFLLKLFCNFAPCKEIERKYGERYGAGCMQLNPQSEGYV